MSALDDIKARTEGHTEGHWEAFTPGRSFGDHWYVCANDEAIAHISANDGIDEEQRRPNAELFAPAPKLLAALKAVEELAASAPRVVGFGGVAFSGIVVADDVLKLIEEALA